MGDPITENAYRARARAADIGERDAERCIWGVSLVADGTIREPWPPRPQNPLMVRKNFDGSKSFGPCIVVDEGLETNALQVRTAVNCELRQDSTAPT